MSESGDPEAVKDEGRLCGSGSYVGSAQNTSTSTTTNEAGEETASLPTSANTPAGIVDESSISEAVKKYREALEARHGELEYLRQRNAELERECDGLREALQRIVDWVCQPDAPRTLEEDRAFLINTATPLAKDALRGAQKGEIKAHCMGTEFPKRGK